MLRRGLIVVGLLCIVAGAAAVLVSRPWHHASGGDEVAVEQATLRPGTIALHLINESEDTAHVAQVIVNDAYVDFNATSRSLAPDDDATVAVAYPWVEGESYEIELLLSTGGALLYEIEDAEAGQQQAA
jgi:zinc transporter, ZIP family